MKHFSAVAVWSLAALATYGRQLLHWLVQSKKHRSNLWSLPVHSTALFPAKLAFNAGSNSKIQNKASTATWEKCNETFDFISLIITCLSTQHPTWLMLLTLSWHYYVIFSQSLTYPMKFCFHVMSEFRYILNGILKAYLNEVVSIAWIVAKQEIVL